MIKESSSTVVDNTKKVNQQGKTNNVVVKAAAAEIVDTKAQESDEYVYRGPKNRSGIFKNSMLLKDLTGFVEPAQPAKETIDTGCQTIVFEEPRAKKLEQPKARLVVDFDITAVPSIDDNSRSESAKKR